MDMVTTMELMRLTPDMLMAHAPLESVRISESSIAERTVSPFSPEDGVLIVRCGGVGKANGEYYWNPERRAWQKTGFIIYRTRRTPGLTPVLWEGQGRWKLYIHCNDREGGGGHLEALYYSIPTNGNFPFMNVWRPVAPEYLPAPVISLVETTCNDKNVFTHNNDELVIPPSVRTESSFRPFEFSYKGRGDDNSDKATRCIVLKRRVKPCHVKILEGRGASRCSGLSAQDKSTESFSNSYIEAVKKEEERFISTEWVLPVISSSFVDEQTSSLHGSLENSLEEVQSAIFNMVEELKKVRDSIMVESEEETFLRIVSSLNLSCDQGGNPSPSPIMEADADMANLNLEGNNSLLWSMVEAKESMLFDSCLYRRRQSRSKGTNVEHLTKEQSRVETPPPPLSNDQHASAKNVPLPTWKWSVRNRVICALDDMSLPLFIDVLVFDDSTNVVVNEIESSSLSSHPPNPSYMIRSTFQHHGFETSHPCVNHSGSNSELRALEDFVQLLQSLQWRSMVVRLDLNQLRILHASLAVSIRDKTQAHLPPFPSPYDLGLLGQMPAGTSSNTLEGGHAVRVGACTAAEVLQQYMTDTLEFARALPQGPERSAFTASLTLALCNPEGTATAPVIRSFNFEWCIGGSDVGSERHKEDRSNNTNLLKRQNMSCAGCGTTLMRCSRGLFNIESRNFYNCTVNGQLFCRKFCYHGSKRIIPHRVIQFGDFSYHRVSDVAANILDEIWALPLVSLKVGHYAYDVEVSKIWKFRQRIIALYQNHKFSRKECSHLETSLSNVLGSCMHLYISDNFWSLEDLDGIQNGSLNHLLQNVLKELQLLVQPGIELDNFG